MKKNYNKLIRDKIPEILEKKGIVFEIETIFSKKLQKALKNKLQEETTELLEAKTREEKVGEFADVLEVLYTLMKEGNISFEEIEAHRKQKYDERGGFEKGIFLISTEEK